MSAFTAYELATGRVRSVQELPECTADPGPPPAGHAYHAGAYAEGEFYFVEGEPTARPVSGVSLEQNGALVTLLGVKAGARIVLLGGGRVEAIEPAEDGPVAFTFPAAGAYHIHVEQFPELDFTAQITA